MNSGENPSQKAALGLLRRIVHYYHAVYTSDTYLLRPHGTSIWRVSVLPATLRFVFFKSDFPHVPNIFSPSGVVDLLSLCNLFELANSLAYTLTDLERHLLVEARRLCRTIVAWLSARFFFSTQRNQRLDLYDDIWMLYLAQEVKVIEAYQAIQEDRHLSSQHGYVQTKIRQCFQNHQAFHAKLAVLGEWEPQRFGWSGDLDFVVTVRDLAGVVDFGEIHRHRTAVS